MRGCYVQNRWNSPAPGLFAFARPRSLPGARHGKAHVPPSPRWSCSLPSHRRRTRRSTCSASGDLHECRRSVQFVVLRECCSTDGESFWAASRCARRRRRDEDARFPKNLPNGDTAGKSVLVATQGFADLGLIAPDYIMPANFLPIGGGTLNFAGREPADVRGDAHRRAHAARRRDPAPNLAVNFAGKPRAWVRRRRRLRRWSSTTRARSLLREPHREGDRGSRHRRPPGMGAHGPVVPRVHRIVRTNVARVSLLHSAGARATRISTAAARRSARETVTKNPDVRQRRPAVLLRRSCRTPACARRARSTSTACSTTGSTRTIAT